MKKIELDIAFEDSLIESMLIWSERCPRVYTRIVQMNGPGGGWPVMEFVAEESDLREWLIEFDCDEVDYIMAEAKTI
jgi:hypothetical protein